MVSISGVGHVKFILVRLWRENMMERERFFGRMVDVLKAHLIRGRELKENGYNRDLNDFALNKN